MFWQWWQLRRPHVERVSSQEFPPHPTPPLRCDLIGSAGGLTSCSHRGAPAATAAATRLKQARVVDDNASNDACFQGRKGGRSESQRNLKKERKHDDYFLLLVLSLFRLFYGRPSCHVSDKWPRDLPTRLLTYLNKHDYGSFEFEEI